MIIGGPGSGKTTLALHLGKLTGLPVVHIDPLYWKPGWVERSKDETHRLLREAASTERWIIEGNNSTTFQDRILRADTLIVLDLSTPRRLWRVIRRTITGYGKVRPGSQTDCPERFDWSFLQFVLLYRLNARWKALELIDDAPPTVRAHRLRNPFDVDRFLRQLEQRFE